MYVYILRFFFYAKKTGMLLQWNAATDEQISSYKSVECVLPPSRPILLNVKVIYVLIKVNFLCSMTKSSLPQLRL